MKNWMPDEPTAYSDPTLMNRVGFEPGLPGWESTMLTTRLWKYYQYLLKKSLDLYSVSLDVALLVRAISMSFFKSLREELSEYMVGSSGIQFFHKIRLGENSVLHQFSSIRNATWNCWLHSQAFGVACDCSLDFRKMTNFCCSFTNF